jgi:hypothetical protein
MARPKSGKPIKKRINISIDPELDERWIRVAKKLKLSKSGMVQEFLEEVLPILEQEKPNLILKSALKKTAEQIDLTATLFD